MKLDWIYLLDGLKRCFMQIGSSNSNSNSFMRFVRVAFCVFIILELSSWDELVQKDMDYFQRTKTLYLF